ncbi:hypothetical protein P3S67_004555 [Capsicum chacoense]
MLHLFFAVAFSAVPLTLYIPPMRSLNLFVETMEDLCRESSVYTGRMYPRLRNAWGRILNCMLCVTTSNSGLTSLSWQVYKASRTRKHPKL